MLNHQTSLMPHTLEGKIVRLSDKIAYINSDFDDVADELIKLALSKGGRDNVTVAVISD